MRFIDNRNRKHGPMHTLTEDVHETLPSGVQVLVGRKGQSMPLAEAQRRGLVGKGPDVQGSQTKDAEPKGRQKGRKAPDAPAPSTPITPPDAPTNDDGAAA